MEIKMRYIVSLSILFSIALSAEELTIRGYGTADPLKAKDERTLALMARSAAQSDLLGRVNGIICPTYISWKNGKMSFRIESAASRGSNVSTSGKPSFSSEIVFTPITPFYFEASMVIDLGSLSVNDGKKIDTVAFPYQWNKDLDLSTYSQDYADYTRAIAAQSKRNLIRNIISNYSPANEEAVLDLFFIGEKRDGNKADMEIRYILRANQ